VKVSIIYFMALFCVGGLTFCQSAPSGVPTQSKQITLERKIELMVRSKFGVPSNCEVKVASRTPSVIPGYDQLRVTVSQGQRSSDVDLLISSDDRKLGRFESFDLDQNPALSIEVKGRPIRGNSDARVTVVNFDDLECPACAYLHGQLFPAAIDRYGDKVRFIYKDNPLVEIHPWAFRAAIDATCMADQGPTAYWSFVDYVHTHGQEVSGDTRNLQKSYARLDQIAVEEAEKNKLNSERLQACLRTQDEAPVRQSMREAAGLGLNYTPALFVNGEEVRGLTSVEDVWRVIDRALRESEPAPKATTK
jgi:protein-disulfide isomerase